MRKLLVTLDDEMDKVLASYPNQNDIVRKALRLYNGDITTESIKSIQLRLVKINQRLASIENAVTKIANMSNVSIDEHSDWGA